MLVYLIFNGGINRKWDILFRDIWRHKLGIVYRVLLFCAVLCCTLLFWAVLCCAVARFSVLWLCCAVLCSAVLCSAVLCCAVLCCAVAVLPCVVLCCAIMCSNVFWFGCGCGCGCGYGRKPQSIYAQILHKTHHCERNSENFINPHPGVWGVSYFHT